MSQQNNTQKNQLNPDEENTSNEAISYSRLIAEVEEQEQTEKQKSKQSIAALTHPLLSSYNKGKALPILQQTYMRDLSQHTYEDQKKKIDYLQRQTERPVQTDNKDQKLLSNTQYFMRCSSPSFNPPETKVMMSSKLRPILQTQHQHKRSDEEACDQKTITESQILIKNKLNNLSSVISHKNKPFLSNSQNLPINRFTQSQTIQCNKRQLDDSVELVADPKHFQNDNLKIEQQNPIKQSKSSQKRVISSYSTASKMFGKKEDYAHLVRTVQNVQATLMTISAKKRNLYLSQQKRSNIIRIEQYCKCYKNGTQSKLNNLSLCKSEDKDKKGAENHQNTQNLMKQLNKLVKEQLWVQLISSSKDINFSLHRALECITKKFKLPQKYKIYSEEPLTVLYDNGIMIQVSYSKKVYMGEYKNINGVFTKHGNGIQIDPSRSIYKGSFKQGLKQGLGKILIINKYTYDGEWKAGIMQGKGIIQTNGKSTYEGQIMNGKKHGYGIEKLNSGDRYEGYFQNNVFHGKGIYRWRSGAIYKGDFMDGQMHGQGRWVSEYGDVYKGSFVKGKKEGKGVYSWKSGKKFQGQFKNGSRVNIVSSKNLNNIQHNDIRFQRSPPSPKKFKIYF